MIQNFILKVLDKKLIRVYNNIKIASQGICDAHIFLKSMKM